MALLDGKVAIVTGAGVDSAARMRSRAKVRASSSMTSASSLSGEGSDPTPAQKVAAEIEVLGSQAAANRENVADFDGARRPHRHVRQRRPVELRTGRRTVRRRRR